MTRVSLFLLALLLASLPAAAQTVPPGFATLHKSGPICPGSGSLCQPIQLPPAYAGPGDLVSGWTYWVGFRAFSNATTGTKAARLCLHSTPATCQDINSLANGNFDTSSAATFCTSACDVATMYDKSGNALDLVQATTAARPAYTINCINTSLPCAVINDSQLVTSAGAIASGTAPQSLVAVAEQTGSPTGIGLIAGDNGVAAGIEFAAPGAVRAFCQAGAPNVTETDNVFHSLVAVCQAGTNLTSLTLDGTSTTSTTTPTNATGFPVQAGGGWFGKFVESGAVEGGVAFTGTQITNLCHNQRIYWGTGGTC